MHLKDLMISLLIYNYESYCQLNDIPQEDFDNLFLDEDDEIMSDKDFFFKNSEALFQIDNLFTNVYIQLSDIKGKYFEIFDELFAKSNNQILQNERSVEYVLSTFFYQYLIYNYPDENKRIFFEDFNKFSYSNLQTMFFNSLSFGSELIKTYYKSLIEYDFCEDSYALMIKNGDVALVEKWKRKIEQEPVITTLNNLLRDVVCQLFDYYRAHNKNIDSSLELVWAFFEFNLDPLNTLKDMNFTDEEIEFCKSYLLKLIIADLYEDSYNDPIISDDSKEAKTATLLPITYAMLGKGLANCKERNKMLYHFILIQQDKCKMIRNREKTKKDGRINVLKKVNPLYFMD